MHWYMSEDIMKNVRFRCVFHRFARADIGCGWELPRCQHFKEGIRRKKTTDWSCVPPSTRPKTLIDGSQVRNPVFTQTDLMKAIEILRAGMLFELGNATAH